MNLEQFSLISTVNYDTTQKHIEKRIPRVPVDFFGQYLYDIILKHKLQKFYPPERLHEIITNFNSNEFYNIFELWELPTFELSLHLSSLFLFNMVAIICDPEGFENNEEDKYDLNVFLSKINHVNPKGLYGVFNNVTSLLKHDADIKEYLNNIKTQDICCIFETLKHFEPSDKPMMVLMFVNGYVSNIAEIISKVINIRMSNQYVFFKIIPIGKTDECKQFINNTMQNRIAKKFITVCSTYEDVMKKYIDKGIFINPHTWLIQSLLLDVSDEYNDEDDNKIPNFENMKIV